MDKRVVLDGHFRKAAVCLTSTARYRSCRAVRRSRQGDQDDGAENQIKGAAKQVEGKIRNTVGDLTDNKSEEIKGKAKDLEGKVQRKIGEAESDAS